MKRAFIIHGWEGFPEEGWFPWLKRELESKGFQVEVPQMPDAANPRIFNWVPKVAEVVGVPDENTYLIGHSMGCQTIARYLETLPEGVRVGGVAFVAGFFNGLSGLEDDAEVWDVRNHWLDTPIDLAKVKFHMNKGVAIFSDNDPYVPLDNQDDFRDKLGCKVLIEHNKGHFSGPSDNITELPVVLEELLEISK